MIRVRLREISPEGGYDKVMEMAAVPRVGDSVAPDEGDFCMEVRTVIWTPGWPPYDVEVRFR